MNIVLLLIATGVFMLLGFVKQFMLSDGDGLRGYLLIAMGLQACIGALIIYRTDLMGKNIQALLPSNPRRRLCLKPDGGVY